MIADQKTILIIDDEALVRQLYSQKLELSGFAVLQADGGASGLSIALSEKPDLIVLDMLMPDMSGYDVLKKLRADAWGATVPVIVLSNDKLEKDENLNILEATGPAYFLQKTATTPADLAVKVMGVLG